MDPYRMGISIRLSQATNCHIYLTNRKYNYLIQSTNEIRNNKNPTKFQVYVLSGNYKQYLQFLFLLSDSWKLPLQNNDITFLQNIF